MGRLEESNLPRTMKEQRAHFWWKAWTDLKKGPVSPIVEATVPIYHGGVPGLDVGDILKPPTVTGYLRPQAVSDLARIPVPFLLKKKTYDPSYVYATRSIGLALDHAAGYGAWDRITGEGRLGWIYEVEPYRCLLEIDRPEPGSDCCCLRIHLDSEPCSFRAKEMRIKHVIEREVRFVDTVGWNRQFKYMDHVNQTWLRRMKEGGWLICVVAKVRAWERL